MFYWQCWWYAGICPFYNPFDLTWKQRPRCKNEALVVVGHCFALAQRSGGEWQGTGSSRGRPFFWPLSWWWTYSSSKNNCHSCHKPCLKSTVRLLWLPSRRISQMRTTPCLRPWPASALRTVGETCGNSFDATCAMRNYTWNVLLESHAIHSSKEWSCWSGQMEGILFEHNRHWWAVESNSCPTKTSFAERN